MKTSKLLDRFENSAKVRAIVEVRDEEGRTEYVTKTFDSIADAHRAMPYVSCSHIEDYCNSTYFSKNSHYFAYDGYYMAFTINEFLKGSYNRCYGLEKEDDNFCQVLLHLKHREFWNEMADKFIASTCKMRAKYPNLDHYADSKLVELISKLESREVAKFMYGLYSDGWHKGYWEVQAKEWLDKNLTREMLLKPGADEVIPNRKPKSIWKQSYKQKYF